MMEGVSTLTALYTVDIALLTEELRHPTAPPRAPAKEVADLLAVGGGPLDEEQAAYVVAVVEALGTHHGGVHPAVFPASRPWYDDDPHWHTFPARVLARYGPVVDHLVAETPERTTLAGLRFAAPWLVTRLDPTEARTAAVVAASAVHPMEPDLAEELADLESAIRTAAGEGLLVVGVCHL